MAILKPVILPAKALKGGRHKIRISLAHNGLTRYFVTDIIIDGAEQFKNGMVVKRSDASYLNTKLRGILSRYQETLDKIEYQNGFSCPQLVCMVENLMNSNNRTLGSVVAEYLDNYKNKTSSKLELDSKLQRMVKIVGADILLQNITPSTIQKLEQSLTKRKISEFTLRSYMIGFKSVLRYASKLGYVDYKISPFVSYQPVSGIPIRECWLTVDEVKRIIDYQPKNKAARRGRDFFLLSYYLGGINAVDLLNINFNENVKTLKYVRTKTNRMNKINKYVEFEIPDEARSLIERYKNSSGFLARTDYESKCSSKTFIRPFKLMREELKLPNLVYYSARKSFSQHALELGVPANVIDYILGHSLGSGRSTLYLYAYITPQMATEAIRKVLDNLK